MIKLTKLTGEIILLKIHSIQKVTGLPNGTSVVDYYGHDKEKIEVKESWSEFLEAWIKANELENKMKKV